MAHAAPLGRGERKQGKPTSSFLAWPCLSPRPRGGGVCHPLQHEVGILKAKEAAPQARRPLGRS